MENLLGIYLLFADLLDYPTPNVRHTADQCVQLLADSCPPAREIFSGFHVWVEQENIAQVEEIYTSTFDLQGICCPYVGHHLFGDNYKRSWFMAKLNAGYKEGGFSCGCELPDHIGVILRFLAGGDADEFRQVLLSEGLIPATAKMVQAFDEDGAHPYGHLLRSLLLVLQAGHPSSLGSLVSSEMGGLANA